MKQFSNIVLAPVRFVHMKYIGITARVFAPWRALAPYRTMIVEQRDEITRLEAVIDDLLERAQQNEDSVEKLDERFDDLEREVERGSLIGACRDSERNVEGTGRGNRRSPERVERDRVDEVRERCGNQPRIVTCDRHDERRQRRHCHPETSSYVAVHKAA